VEQEPAVSYAEPRLKIALYHCRLPQLGSKPGGVQVFVDRLAIALQERGHTVTAFTFAPPTEARPYAVRVLRPRRAADSKFLRQYVAPWLFNARPFGARFDVAHLHGDDWFYLRRRVPTVRTFYGSALMEALTATSLRRKLNQSILFGLEQLARARADAVYGIGPDSQMLYRADGILGCGVPEPDDPASPDPVPTILFVGTWEGRKRGSLLHRVFHEQVRPIIGNARLVMVSDFAEEGEGVTWLPHPTDVELAELYRRAWAFCLPSSYEGFGIPYLEALANGLPVVATPNPGANQILDAGRYGLIVNPEDLGQTLLRALTDDALRSRLSIAANERMQSYSWDRLIIEYEGAYDLAIRRFRARR
jgi:glycosyltransferase involved in cell wall biosynthesis